MNCAIIFDLKFLFVSPEALSVDLAYKIIQEGNEVKFYIHSETEKDVGDGFVEKVGSWEDFIEWADVIVFDDIGFGKIAEKLRSDGKKVIGGSSYTDRLENDREFGQTELDKAGVTTLPSQIFSDFEEAIQFVQSKPGRYVIKPSGKAQNEKELLFVGQEEDGNDVINVLAHYKKNWSNKIKVFQIQQYSSGVEVAVGAFFNGKEFVTPVNINFEHKRLFPGDIGPSTGEMGCYDDQTEVLTNNGWKLFKDLDYGDKICTLNPFSHVIEFHKPDLVVSFNHHKKLVSIQNHALDIAVTPDHSMYVYAPENAKSKADDNKFSFVKANDLQYPSLTKRTGTWIGVEQEFFTLPPSIMTLDHYKDRQAVAMLLDSTEQRIPMDDWIAFMGIWLADGSVTDGKSTTITPRQKKKLQQAESAYELLERLPFKFIRGEEEGVLYCHDKQLYLYLKGLGKAYCKHVPKFIKELSARQIEIFLRWFALSKDTSIEKNCCGVFCTTSSRLLADDIQELLLKTGRIGLVRLRRQQYTAVSLRMAPKDSNMDISHEKQYFEVVEEATDNDNSWIGKKDVKTVDYDGKVYCATVKNHIMYVRKNGKPCWCGNTLMFWSHNCRIFELTLEKMKPKLVEAGYAGYIDINCIANGSSIYPLEFTSRFGYPTISIQMEGVTSEWGKFLHSLARGENAELHTKRGFQVGVVVAVPPFPFNDEKTFRKFSEEATILFRKQNETDGVHIGEVKRDDNNDWRIAGRSGYSLVITSSGATTEEARNQAYSRVANVMIPNMFYRTDIGSRWIKDSDLLLSLGYLQ